MASNEFVDHVTEALAGVGHIVARRMFGGVGLYCDGRFFAIIVDSALYFKTDEQCRKDFEARDCPRFSYVRQGKTVYLNYYQVPTEALDDPAALQYWARKALAAARPR